MASRCYESNMVEYRRFFVEQKNVTDSFVTITGAELKHLSGVLRMRIGDRAIACINNGKDILCEIENINKDCAHLKILDIFEGKSELPCDITLFQAIIKGDKTDIAIQKAVELGIKKIVMFESDFTVAKTDNKEERYNRIALEAAKQCGRSINPKVEIMSFNDVVDSLNGFDLNVFCNERESNVSLFSMLNSIKNESTMSVIVGSEGGFSEKEAVIFAEKAVSVSLGKRILRAETASIFVLSVIGAYLER